MSDIASWREIILKGHKTFPHTSWASTHRWKPSPTAFFILILGLSLFGVGEGLLVVAGIGNSPWVVLSEGITIQTGLNIGASTALVSVFVFLLWIPLREKPGLGTVMNIIVIAAVLGITVELLPPVTDFRIAVLVAITGVLMVGLASALYLTTQLGPGPRDGLMTSLHNKSGIRVSRVRLMLEVSVLTMGWLLGGTVGLGTVLFAAGIGRAVALWLGVVARLAQAR